MIGRNGERRSGISAQAARHDDDDDLGLGRDKTKYIFEMSTNSHTLYI